LKTNLNELFKSTLLTQLYLRVGICMTTSFYSYVETTPKTAHFTMMGGLSP